MLDFPLWKKISLWVMTLALAALAIPSLMGASGLGGAVDLISACDLRLTSADARFAIEEINIGMAADVGTLQRLRSSITPRRA